MTDEIIDHAFCGGCGAAGTDRFELEMDHQSNLTVQDIKIAMMERLLPLAALLDRVWFAVNNEYAGLETVVHDSDQVAVIPPVSGGQGDV